MFPSYHPPIAQRLVPVTKKARPCSLVITPSRDQEGRLSLTLTLTLTRTPPSAATAAARPSRVSLG